MTPDVWIKRTIDRHSSTDRPPIVTHADRISLFWAWSNARLPPRPIALSCAQYMILALACEPRDRQTHPSKPAFPIDHAMPSHSSQPESIYPPIDRLARKCTVRIMRAYFAGQREKVFMKHFKMKQCNLAASGWSRSSDSTEASWAGSMPTGIRSWVSTP